MNHWLFFPVGFLHTSRKSRMVYYFHHMGQWTFTMNCSLRLDQLSTYLYYIYLTVKISSPNPIDWESVNLVNVEIG